MTDTDPQREQEERRKLAQETYKEVLDATKHQDDKIGRFLTSIAFLTGGTIAFGFSNKDILGLRYQVGASVVPLPAVLFSMFLVLVLVGVLLLIISLGPNVSIPKGAGSGRKSHLFFLSIAGQRDDEWRAKWNQPIDELRKDIGDDYVQEAFNLAEKTDFKYRRTSEARAVLSVGLLCLALGVVLAVAGSPFGAARPQPVAFSIRPRLFAGLITAVFVLLLGYDSYRLEQSMTTYRDSDKAESLSRLGLAALLLPLVPVLVLVPAIDTDAQYRAGAAALALILLCWAAYLLWDRYQRHVSQIVMGCGVAVVAGGIIVASAIELGPWRLALAGGPAVLVDFPRLLTGFDTWSRRKEKATPP